MDLVCRRLLFLMGEVHVVKDSESYMSTTVSQRGGSSLEHRCASKPAHEGYQLGDGAGRNTQKETMRSNVDLGVMPNAHGGNSFWQVFVPSFVRIPINAFRTQVCFPWSVSLIQCSRNPAPQLLIPVWTIDTDKRFCSMRSQDLWVRTRTVCG